MCTASPAFAQITQGRLTGLVTDAQGAVLPGATVTATSPALIGQQTTVTQPDGRYLFPAMGPIAVSFTCGWLAWWPPRRGALAVMLLLGGMLALALFALFGTLLPASGR